ncbi:unnamed protein product [Effrenium voratum]|nr:unnamed protein product [Effrenium voratum]
MASTCTRPPVQKDPNQVLDIEEAAANVGWHEREVPIRAALLRWYLNHRRKLPWRGDPSPWTRSKARPSKQGKHQIQRTLPGVFGKLNSACRPAVIDLDEEDTQKEEQCFHRSAYGVWISEVMLQQTQVEVVIDYWTTWMRSFPSVPALAAASADEVNAVWAGLGFYGRARRLHEGAKYLFEKHDGELPQTLEALRGIPGVGPYTAGAIASIALGLRAPVVDGNVERVFSRLQGGLGAPAKSAKLQKVCWELAEELVDPEDPGAFNQALMELGALICTPSSPSCQQCPVRPMCRAHQRMVAGEVASVTIFPGKALKKPRRERVLALAAVSCGEEWVLVRRPARGLLANQLQFPCLELAEADLASGASQLQALLASFGLEVDLEPRAGALEHLFSHERHVMHVFQGHLEKKPASQEERELIWLTASDAERAGITSGLQKVFDALGPSPKKRKRRSC